MSESNPESNPTVINADPEPIIQNFEERLDNGAQDAEPRIRINGLLLQKHKNNKKPFICNFSGCGREFKRNEHMQRHAKIHTGVKPYRCEFPGCLRLFTRYDNLTAHTVRVHVKAKRLEDARTLSNQHITPPPPIHDMLYTQLIMDQDDTTHNTNEQSLVGSAEELPVYNSASDIPWSDFRPV